ncbi:GDSL-type esterase/lipase family protein [Sphingobacterium siyangense]|uniref:GDSL-type esterase/lipase family protein n=1 Tax=Sphingobacterium siyangense TaxID=459529 RepID=UPI002FDEE3B4
MRLKNKKKRIGLSETMYLLLLIIIPFYSFLSKSEEWAIIFVGDSITEGGALPNPQTQAPPARAFDYVKSKSGKGMVGFSNQGHGGATTFDFLPGKDYYKNVQKAADFYEGKPHLLFSIMLGANDSAIEGTTGAPVSEGGYVSNLEMIIDSLHVAYPNSAFVLHKPLWYSSNTYNSAKYLQEGLDRIGIYGKAIDKLVAQYGKEGKNYVFVGDTNGYAYFKKNHMSKMRPQEGRQGVFYLHPNEGGSQELGILWARALLKKVLD